MAPNCLSVIVKIPTFPCRQKSLRECDLSVIKHDDANIFNGNGAYGFSLDNFGHVIAMFHLWQLDD